MININEQLSMSANITVVDTNGNETSVAGLNVSNLDTNTMNITIGVTVYNKILLTKDGAANKAGETPAQQYSQFEAAVKAKAKALGYVIFA